MSLTRRGSSRSSGRDDVKLEPIRIVNAKAERAAVIHLTIAGGRYLYDSMTRSIDALARPGGNPPEAQTKEDI